MISLIDQQKEAIVKDRVFSLPKAAKLCGLSRGTIWNNVKSGELKSFRTPGGQYRILRQDLIDFMTRKKMPPLLSDPIRQGRILVADDDAAIARMICRILEPFGFDTDTASDGFEAGIKLVSFRPEMIILDLFMPGMDGFEVCRRLKQNPATAHIKVLAISGQETPETRQRILDEGADAFMGKPLNTQALVQEVVRLLYTNGPAL